MNKNIMVEHKLLSKNNLHFHTNSPINVRQEREIVQTDLIMFGMNRLLS